MTDLFVGRAKAETMQRDFDRLRRAIRAWDAEETERAWEKCERWVSCLSANEGISHISVEKSMAKV